jgi:tetrahydromethanopterin S-methyltransferase subunit B
VKAVGSYEWRRDQVSAAVQARAKANAASDVLASGGAKPVDIYVSETYADFVIVRDYGANKWWKVPYAIDEKTGEVTLGEATEVAQTWVDIQKGIRMLIPVEKADDPKPMRQITYGVIAEPSTETVLKADLQGDCFKPEDIELMAHGFMERSQAAGEMHKSLVPGAKVVESYLAPIDFVVKTADGDETVLKGSWVLAMKWPDEQWQKIQKGELTGYSIGGTGLRTPVTSETGDQVAVVSKAAGATSDPLPLNWLHGVDVAEVSAVDKAANGKKFLILKANQPVTPADGRPSLVGWVLQAFKKTAGNAGPQREVDEMTADEIKKAIAEGAAEALAPMNERIEKLEAALQPAGEPAAAEPATEPVTKAEETPAPAPTDIAKMVTDGVAEAMKPITERIEKLETVQGERQSALDANGPHKVEKNASIWEGSGLLLG